MNGQKAGLHPIVALLVLAGCCIVGFGGAGSAAHAAPAVVGPPTVTSISPMSGTMNTPVQVTGTNFVVGSTNIIFGANSVVATCQANMTTCFASAPAGTGTVQITASTPNGTSVANGVTFMYSSGAVPTISNINPTSGPAGTGVTINGTNFGVGTSTVAFGSVPSTTFSCTTAILCTATAPAQAAGVTAVQVTVTDSGGTSNGATFTYTSGGSVPTITNLNPASGAAGISVTITGTNFEQNSTSTFGGVTATTTCQSATSCTATAPAQQAGVTTAPVVVTNSAGPSTGFTFTYTSTAQLTLNPTSGPAGATISIIGTGFSTTAGVTTVLFGSVSATSVTCASTAACTAVAPSQASGTTNVTVAAATNGVTVGTATFTYTSTGSSLTISPTTGPAGTTVTFTGTGFVVNDTSVLFGGKSVTATCSSTTSCTAVAPSQPSGTTNVTVSVSAAGLYAGQATFTYTSTSAVTLTAITPTTAAAGSTVTITGTGFVSGSTSFTFNGNGASNVNCSTTSCTMTVPGGSGTVSVIATVSGSQSNSLQFTYGSAQLSLNAIGPFQGTVGTSTSFSASGTNLPGDTTFTWNFGDSGTATSQSASHIYTAAGTYTVTLTANSASTGGTGSVTAQATISGGQTVTYQAGWNLIGVPTGTILPQTFGPLYTFQAGDVNYESVANSAALSGGRGYWAYFNTTTTVTLTGTNASLPLSLSLPAGQFIMVGNPNLTGSVTISGADVVYTYSPVTNGYVAAGTSATLTPGQGAWVYSANGGGLTIR